MKVDRYRDKGLRKKLVDHIAKKGIKDQRILDAIEKVPRHFFFSDNVFHKEAYQDKAFPIGEGQTISQPFTVAYQSELLNVQKGDKILEIGTGSGYQACILSELGAKVFSIERIKSLYEKTSELLAELGYRSIKTFFGDGYEGLPTYAPFDKIIITAAAPAVPDKLLEQLVIGGIMVLPLGDGIAQDMIRITKKGEKEYEKEVFEKFAFVPMLKGKNF